MPIFLNGKIPVEPDEQGRYAANCSVCFQDRFCISITYPRIVEICKSFNLATYSFAVCESCYSTKDKQDLHTNIMDYFVMNELTRWMTGDKQGVVRSEFEFRTLIKVAEDRGVLYREEKRMRNRYTKPERAIHNGFLNLLKKEKTNDYTPSVLYQNFFKKFSAESNN